MDPEITALAGTAGATLVTLLVTEGWQRARDGFVGLWRRAHPERAEAIAGEIDATRADLIRVRAVDGQETQETEAELRAEWQGRIRRLLADHPEVSEELRTLLTQLPPTARPAPVAAQHATASGQARVYQAGRDMHIRER